MEVDIGASSTFRVPQLRLAIALDGDFMPGIYLIDRGVMGYLFMVLTMGLSCVNLGA